MFAALKPFAARAWLDRLSPPDPGALRLLGALRATLAGVLAFFAVVSLGLVAPTPAVDRILGFGVALFVTATLRDSGARRQAVTIALAPFAAFAATALAALLIGHRVGAAVAVPSLMFLAIYGAARGPRYATLGMVAVIAYIVGLVGRLPPDTLPIRFAVVIVAALAAAVARFVLLPDRPQAEVDRLRRAVHVCIAQALGRIAEAVAAGAWSEALRAGLRRDVYRLGDVVMLAQTRVAALVAQLHAKESAGSRWLHLLEIELAVERAARVALQDLGPAADRAALLAQIAALRRGGEERPPPRCAPPLSGALALLDHVLHEAPPIAPTVAVPPAPGPTSGLRPALQTAIATGLAIVVGDFISPNRWYWAAFAAFIMFQGTRSRGESIAKGVQFMAGTLAGVVIGTIVAALLSGHDVLSMAAIVVAVFLAFQANVAAYGVMTFWVTIILGLMFGMLGYFTPDLLLVRLQEAAVGAACGALVACLILVRRDRVATHDATIAFLRALGQAVDCAARILVDDVSEPELAARILAAEQRVRDLKAIAQGEMSGPLASRNEALRRRVLVLEACEQWARELGQLGLQSVRLRDPDLARSARAALARIDATLACLASRLPVQPALAAGGDEPAEDLDLATPDEPATRAVRLLLRIDAALVLLASRQGLAPAARVAG